jgi:hypothetical protein
MFTMVTTAILAYNGITLVLFGAIGLMLFPRQILAMTGFELPRDRGRSYPETER